MDRSGRTIKEALSEAGRIDAVKTLLADGASSRTRMAIEVCEQFGFLDFQGRPQVGSCLRALRDFEEDGELVLDITSQQVSRAAALLVLAAA